MEVDQDLYCERIFLAVKEYNKKRLVRFQGFKPEDVVIKNWRRIERLAEKHNVKPKHIGRVVGHEYTQRGYGISESGD